MSDVLTDRLVQAPGVLSQELDGEVLLLADGSVDALHLNTTASAVWRLLREGPTLVELVAALSEANGLSPQQVAEDVGNVLEVLFARGAALRRPAGP